jgi:hypothetical protein
MRLPRVGYGALVVVWIAAITAPASSAQQSPPTPEPVNSVLT